MKDQKIIELIKSNQHDKTLATLYNYLPVVKKMILANGGKAEDAEDIYQEALIVFYRKAKSAEFILSSTVSTYLYSICRFMWMEQIKKNKKQDFVDIEKEVIDENEFSAHVEEEEQFKLAEKVISELGERCRDLLIMFYVHSKRLKDIALEMGYNSENTTKNQKYKCLETAKEKLRLMKNVK
jgi:RNA polymerase sigma factor (sigma-70 family)